ncbi:hypothetical protein C9J60_01735 [Streptomyces sp. A244]|uniref:hypothetical protein n=1 Tax=Streptomyces TaxID=1883 RepID=UPI000D1A0CFE|nr:hypothetical protein [Streptomyces sp. A244]PTH89749.1 hypothetical protein C9J60_01735 [Streptomyces sp. A244]
MTETVAVRCPACRREHRYTAPAYPCACGAPVAPRLDRDGSPTPVSHRVWQDEWVTVRCGSCGRHGEWPHPEVGCACGVVLRVAVMESRGGIGDEKTAAAGASPTDTVAPADVTPRPDAPTADDDSPRPGPAADPRQETTADAPPAGETAPRSHPQADPCGPATVDASAAGDATSARPPFRSVTIRTALDAVTATALYLRWLGYRGVRRADQRPPSGIGLAARGVVAQVDPAVRPAGLRDVECLWLTAMTESADGLYFSLAGYADDARARADALGVPLFVLDLTGTPRPVNAPAETLAATGSGQRAP